MKLYHPVPMVIPSLVYAVEMLADPIHPLEYRNSATRLGTVFADAPYDPIATELWNEVSNCPVIVPPFEPMMLPVEHLDRFDEVPLYAPFQNARADLAMTFASPSVVLDQFKSPADERVYLSVNATAQYFIALTSLAGVMSLAVVLVPAWYSASVILEYEVLSHPTICQYVPSYIKEITDPAFHDVAVLVEGAVVPYRLMATSPVPLTLRVGLATVLPLSNFTLTTVPTSSELIDGDTVTVLTDVPDAVEHTP